MYTVYSNRNDEMLVEFAMKHSLAIMETFLKHRNICKDTWKSPVGCAVNQIDNFLVH